MMVYIILLIRYVLHKAFRNVLNHHVKVDYKAT